MSQQPAIDGPSVNVSDPRLSNLIAWGGSIAVALVVSGIVWVGSQLVGIRESLADMAATQREQSSSFSMQINDLKDEVHTLRDSNDRLSQKVASLEGKAERGFKQGKEPFRGD